MEGKPVLRLKDSLTYGNIWIAIAAVLSRERKAYAYTLPEKIRKRFGFSPNKIMTYLVLYKLEDEGMIRSHFESRRKYYELTGRGRKARAEAKKILSAMARSI